jgi:FtsP/CotA-like multicopper oxidase with cupredoxin domain
VSTFSTPISNSCTPFLAYLSELSSLHPKSTIRSPLYFIIFKEPHRKQSKLITALIIHPKNETGRGDNVTWDEEYTLVVSDWYHRQHYDLLEEFMSWKNPTGAEPVPGMSSPTTSIVIERRLIVDSAAIYVLHKDEYLPSAAAIRSGEGVNDNAKIHFEPGKTYKIRMINMSALASMSSQSFHQTPS